MSRFTSLYCRVPRPKTMFGISLQTATELICLSLVFNKVTGFYGLLAILTGYELSLLQVSTYLYSILVLVALVPLIPHIRRQSPWECLALAYLYIGDTVVNSVDTFIFGVEWYLASAAKEGTEYLPDMFAQGLDGLKQETAMHGQVVSHETATSMSLILGLTLLRVYFSIIVMAYARRVLQAHMAATAVDNDGVEAEEPFGPETADGEGRRGKFGRLMISYGRGYWLDTQEGDATTATAKTRSGFSDEV